MKLLVGGDVKGNFKQFFSRVNSIHKKNGPFEMLLCVGQFFDNTPECEQQWAEFVDGKEIVPLPTVILGPTSTEHAQYFKDLSADGGEMCANLTCLGQRGVYVTSSGLTIAYLSGRHNYDAYKTSGDAGKLVAYFTSDDIASVESQCKEKAEFQGVDILATAEWPKGADNLAQPPEDLDMKRVGAQPISRLAYSLKPRYHFSALHERFYARIPYRNHTVLKGSQRHVTRFIALGNEGNPDKKQRHLYAFSITPMSGMDHKELIQQPPSATNNPYTDIVRNRADGQESLPEQNFFFDERALAAGRKRKQLQDGGKCPPLSKRPPLPRGPCWFCLGGEQVEKHLVVSVGEHSYIALPKGGLVSDHVLILPIGHYAASTEAPEEVIDEMGKFKAAMRKYCRSKNKSCVIFERNFKSQHLQLQVVPVPDIPSAALRQAFLDQGGSTRLQLDEALPDLPTSKLAHIGEPYFRVEFDDGASLFTKIKAGRFPLQFGREVLASALILNIPERSDWKSCASTKEEETVATRKMRTQFQPFDFTEDD